MKKKLIIGLGLISLFSLVGCVTPQASSSEVSTTVESVTSESQTTQTTQSGNKKYDEKFYKLPEGFTETSMYMSYSGALIDINVDKEFVTGQEEVFGFSYTNIYSDTSVVESSNEDVFTIEKITETSYKIKAKHEGNAALVIKDDKGLHRYRHVVYVRDPKSLTEMNDYLADIDYWQSYAGYGDSYRLTFLFDNQVAISGSVSNTPFQSFTATYKFVKETDIEYQYTFTGEEAKNNSANLTGFNISKTGDFMYLQYTNGTAAIMFPNTRTFD